MHYGSLFNQQLFCTFADSMELSHAALIMPGPGVPVHHVFWCLEHVKQHNVQGRGPQGPGLRNTASDRNKFG